MIESAKHAHYPRTLVVIQHLLPDTIQFLLLLKDHGWNIDRVVAVPYTTQAENVQMAEKAGIEVLTPEVIDAHFVSQLIEDVHSRCGRFLLHEVGGYCAEVLAARPELRAAVRGVVEETKQGLWRYSRFAHELAELPIVQIADNELKRVEGEFVGAAIVRVLRQWNEVVGGPAGAIGIVGLGDIGSGVARAFLRQGKDVLGYDREPVRMLTMASQGVECADLVTVLEQSAAVVGATGVGAFGADLLCKVRNESLLVSASSRQLEFPVNAIRSGELVRDTGVFQTFRLHGRLVSLACEGYPANFHVGSLPATLADLMFAQIAFALDIIADRSARAGILPLPDSAIHAIAQGWWDQNCPNGGTAPWRFSLN